MKHSAALIVFLLLFGAAAAAGAAPVPARAFVLDADSFRHHVDYFNGMVEEGVVNHIPNAEAWAWMKQNIPSHPRLGVCADSRSSGQIVC